jgi:hypothetical protein
MMAVVGKVSSGILNPKDGMTVHQIKSPPKRWRIWDGIGIHIICSRHSRNDQMEIRITEATVIETMGADKIFLKTSLPEATYPFRGKASLSMHAAKGTGADYVRRNFGLEPDIIVSDET